VPPRRAYCCSIGWEIGHVHDPVCRRWLAERAEEDRLPEPEARAEALALIARSEHLEATFGRRMPGVKTSA